MVKGRWGEPYSDGALVVGDRYGGPGPGAPGGVPLHVDGDNGAALVARRPEAGGVPAVLRRPEPQLPALRGLRQVELLAARPRDARRDPRVSRRRGPRRHAVRGVGERAAAEVLGQALGAARRHVEDQRLDGGGGGAGVEDDGEEGQRRGHRPARDLGISLLLVGRGLGGRGGVRVVAPRVRRPTPTAMCSRIGVEKQNLRFDVFSLRTGGIDYLSPKTISN